MVRGSMDTVFVRPHRLGLLPVPGQAGCLVSRADRPDNSLRLADRSDRIACCPLPNRFVLTAPPSDANNLTLACALSVFHSSSSNFTVHKRYYDVIFKKRKHNLCQYTWYTWTCKPAKLARKMIKLSYLLFSSAQYGTSTKYVPL